MTSRLLKESAAEAEQVLGTLQVPLRTKLHLKVASAMVAEYLHVQGEAGNEVDPLRIGLEVDEQVLGTTSYSAWNNLV